MTIDLETENNELRLRLEEAEETLHAIRTGAVDAFVVEEPTGDRIYTLDSADRPYRLLVERMQQGAATLYLDGTIAYCNQRLADLLKIPTEKLIGSSFHRFIHSTDFPVYINLLTNQNGNRQGEVYLWGMDGNPIPVYLSFNKLQDDGGPVAGLLVTDLTAQKHHEQSGSILNALQLSEQRFRSLAIDTTSIIWTADPEGRFVSEQPSWSAYTGKTAEQLRGYGWIDTLHPDDRGNIKGLLQQSRKTCTSFKSDVLLWHVASNMYRHFEIRVVPVMDTNGSIREWVGKCVDVEAQVRAEKQVYGLMTELQEAGRRKDEFLAVLAHELRGPLAPLRNSLEALKQAEANADITAQVCSIMERQLDHMVKLVDDLRDVSRINQGRIELKRERITLQSVIAQAVEACDSLVKQAGLQLNVDLPAEPVYLDGDYLRLTQVFNNMLDNSCKYTRPGGTIWLTARPAGNEVVVEVKDTGIGIPSAMLPHIFELFTQVNRSQDRSQGGLGIGLSLVKRFVEMHTGTVTASSDGRGCNFIIRLPVLTDITNVQDPTPLSDTERKAIRHRILIVDDNIDSAKSLALLLKIAGNETHIAHDGLYALASAEQTRPDVVVLDIGLPGMNGFDVARRIREQEWGKNVLLIALTGWGKTEDYIKSKNAGFDAHLVKPVEYSALERTLNKKSQQSVQPAH